MFAAFKEAEKHKKEVIMHNNYEEKEETMKAMK